MWWLLHPPQCVRCKEEFCLLSSCPLLHDFNTGGMLLWVFIFSIVEVTHLCVMPISNKFSNVHTYVFITSILNSKWGTWRFF